MELELEPVCRVFKCPLMPRYFSQCRRSYLLPHVIHQICRPCVYSRLLQLDDPLELILVPSDSPPPYAILSHNWGATEDEILFKDVADCTYAKKPSHLKAKKPAKKALEDGLDHAWIDNCSIDRGNLAELQEVINSKYRHTCMVQRQF